VFAKVKMRILKLNSSLIKEMLLGQCNWISNLPNDLELIDITFDVFAGKATFLVRSDVFEDLEESYPIPEFNLEFNKSTKKAPESITKFQKKYEVDEGKIIDSNQEINAFQKEFSPEQRELLNFQIEGDYLIVKPVKYLKNEWNDINVVVKNIGGEWVKGSIISYWKVPIR